MEKNLKFISIDFCFTIIQMITIIMMVFVFNKNINKHWSKSQLLRSLI